MGISSTKKQMSTRVELSMLFLGNFFHVLNAQYRSHNDETADGLNLWGHLEDKGDGGVPIVRPNFDTIYSAAILDTESGKIMIELPKSERYMSVYCFDQDQYQVYYGTGDTFYLN